MFYFKISFRIREMEQLRLEREKQDMSNIQRKLELSQLDNEIELKKNEIAQKRAEDLAESYLKTKNLKVTLYILVFN